MIISENAFVTFSFSSLVVACLTLLGLSDIRHIYDKAFIYFLLLSSTSFLLINNPYVIDATHLLFMFSIFAISLVSYNKFILLLNIVIVIIIVLSRLYFGHCVINIKQKGKGTFLKINKIINNKGTITQGNLLFTGILLFTIFKLVSSCK